MQIRRVGNTPQLLPKREIRHGRGAEGAGLPAGSVPRFVRLNPELDVNQYAHNAWTIRDGFFNGPVRTIAQTPDGYLWLGTELGLLRFDGVRCVQWQAPGDERLPSSNVRRLLASRDGRLWIGTDSGLVNWKGINLTKYAEFAGRKVGGLLEDREGAIWAGIVEPTGKLCRVQSAAVQCFGEDGIFGESLEPSYEDSPGNLWVAAQTGYGDGRPVLPNAIQFSLLASRASLKAKTGRSSLASTTV